MPHERHRTSSLGHQTAIASLKKKPRRKSTGFVISLRPEQCSGLFGSGRIRVGPSPLVAGADAAADADQVFAAAHLDLAVERPALADVDVGRKLTHDAQLALVDF